MGFKPRSRKCKKSISTVVCSLLSTLSLAAYAGGFELHDESVTYLGNAYAGTCSAAQDGSTAYYNPAGMIELKHSEFVAGYTHIRQKIELYDEYGTISHGDPLTGTDPSKPSANLSLPTGHISLRLSDSFSLGFSIVQPFGLYTEYGASDMARIMATKTKITTIDYSPSIAFRLNPSVDVGAGLDILRTLTTMSSAVSWTNIGTESNGYINFSASKWQLGYHVGIILKPRKSTKVGLTYFSKFTPKFFSKQVLSKFALDFTQVTTVNYSMTLPSRINLGATYDHNPNWTFMGELELTQWNKLQGMVFDFYIADAPGVKNLNFKNTWRASLGTDYKFNKMLTIKAGLGFDQSPTKSGYREVMMPDSDRYLLGIGARLNLHKNFSVVAGYMHTFFRGTTINEIATNDSFNLTPFATNKATFNAKVKDYADTLGIQMVLSFF